MQRLRVRKQKVLSETSKNFKMGDTGLKGKAIKQ